MSERITQIKAELYDLIHHVCDGSVSFPQKETDRACRYCEQTWMLQDELLRLVKEKKAGGKDE